MQGSTHPGAVTPAGVRDGDPAALEGLCARRGAAVLAFCREVCEPDAVPVAAAEAFARFRAAVVVLDDLSGVNPDELLLGATRHAAASLALSAPGDGPRLLGLGARGRSEACAFVPEMLVARAGGALGEADLDRLEKHLEKCAGCREVEAAFARAEHAYREPGGTAVPPDVAHSIVAAMAAAAPVSTAPAAPPPAEAEPEPEPEPAEPEPEPAEPEPAIQPDLETAETVELDALELEPESYLEPDRAGQLDELEEPDEAQAQWQEQDDPSAPTAEPEAEEELAAPVVVPAPSPAGQAAAAEATPPSLATPTALPRTRRRSHVHWPAHVPHVDQGRLRAAGLPAAVVTLALLGSMAIAGVFGGSEPTPPTGAASAQEPIFPIGSAGAPARGTAAAAAAEIARQAQRAQRRVEKARVERLQRRRGTTRDAGTTAPPASSNPTPAPSGAAPVTRPPAGGNAGTRDQLDAGRAGGTGSAPATDPPVDSQDPGSYVPGTGGATPPPPG